MSGERLEAPQPEQIPVRELQVGQPFKPFEGLTALPHIEHDDVYTLLAMPVQLFGIRGGVSLLTEPAGENLTEIVTPLGRARFVRSFEGDGYTIEEAPLSLELTFGITSIDQFYRLNPYIMEFNLGGLRYYLRCGGWDGQKAVEGSIVEDGEIDLFDAILKSSEGESEANVLVPYDLGKLTGIEAQIVERATPIR